MSVQTPTTKQDLVKYNIDNFMSKGGFSVFLSLLLMFFIAFVLMGITRIIAYLIFPDPTIENALDLLWYAFFQIIDAGALAELDANSNIAGKLVGIVTIFIGLILFSSMVAFITQQFEERLSVLRKGKSKVIEADHTLIIGFSDRIIDIIHELVEANESEEGVVVILADKDKEEMDDFLRERVGELHTTRVITRSGSTTSLKNLRNVGVDVAHSAMILNSAKASDNNHIKELADAKVLKTIMAVLAAKGEENMPPIIAEVHIERYQNLAQTIAQGKITTLNEADILARLLVQTSRSDGLSMVYSDLVGYEGNEFYFYKPDEGWHGLTFGALQFHFMQSVPLGIRSSEGKITMNPPKEKVMSEEDEIVILAEDDSTIDFSLTPVIEPVKQELSTLRIEVPLEKHLIIGWNNKTPIVLREYAAYMIEGSEVNLAVSQISDEITEGFNNVCAKFPKVKMKVNEVDFSDFDEIKKLNLPDYTTISLLAGRGEDADEIDSKTIMRLLQFRSIFKEYTQESGKENNTKLITEVVESDNTELVLKAGVKDFLISNQFVSKIFAQVSQDPDVMRVYDDLFSEDGSEVYVKKMELFFPFEEEERTFTFGDCVLAAQERGEVCFGIKVKSEEAEPDKDFGIYLIPNKDESFVLNAKDSLITLAEDES